MNNDLEQFSEERLKDIIELVDNPTMAALARIALSVKQANPVAWITWHQGCRAPDDCEDYLNAYIYKTEEKSVDGSDAFPVYTTPQPAHTEQVIPSEIPKVPHNGVIAYKKDGSIYSTNYARGWNDCVQAMLAAAPKPGGWINCSELMPEEMEDVLVTDGEDVKSMWWNGREWDSFVGKHQYSISSDEITYWMPLPTPFKQDK